MKRITILIFLLILFSIALAGNVGYYRFPTLYNNIIVFTAEGDLWFVSTNGGIANRLTTHHGMESHAAISPDGKIIAFSAQYEGTTEVYTIPFEGGIPTRQTYDGGNAIVIGWTPDGKILYSTTKFSTLPNTQLVSIDLKNSDKTIIPLAQASDGSYNNRGETLFFTRLQFQGSRTKRYKGGTAQNIWKFKQDSEAEPLTSDYAGTSKNPMWFNKRLYFVSDRDGTMNLWSMDESGKELIQHTFHSGLDISNPSLFKGKIVYQLISDLHIFEISNNSDTKLNITLTSDFDQMREKWIKKPAEYITNYQISPEGNRALLTARGQVFIVPSENGRIIKVADDRGIRFRDAVFMPDGKSVIVLSDKTGEFEYWKYSTKGNDKGLALTGDADILRNAAVPSPDGKMFAFTDRNDRLWIYNFERNKNKLIASSEYGGYYQLSWSSDSKLLAYATSSQNWFTKIEVYNIAEKKTTAITSDRVDSYNPVWSPDSKWLYFLSDRSFRNSVRSPWGNYQPEPYYTKTTKIYMAALTEEMRSPFLPDDELSLAEKEKEKDNKKPKDTGKRKKKGKTKINFSEIERRIIEIPVSAGNYSALSSNEKYLFWIERDNNKSKLKALKIKNKDIKAKKLIDGIRGYELSSNGKKLMVRKSNNFYIIEASDSKPAKLDKKKVSIKDWTMSITPHDEWRQIFIDAWRMERDYFYDPGMHGADYEGLLKRYLPYTKKVTDRYELNDLIAHIVGELSALHTFVGGGDSRKAEEKVKQGFLGAILEKDKIASGYRIKHIYTSEPDYISKLSPLAKPELNINDGDLITQINGKNLLDVADPAILLKNQVGKQVLLTLKSGKNSNTFSAVVKPISQAAESNLRYSEWEYERRLEVDKIGNKKIGYVHLRAMGGNNFTEWMKNYYPIFNRRGLIIDVRNNRGGNIDSWILEKLLRKAWFYWQGRVGKPYWNMQYAFRGHMVVLCNERTASDGEAFAEGFRQLGLGKIIGTRTWGGEIWLSFNNRLVDKGIASAAQTGVYGNNRKWLIEGHGVDPDIVVDNLPHETFKGKDTQLETAIKHLQKLIAKDPRDVPSAPPYPNKSLKKK